jgi:hypothetical protein
MNIMKATKPNGTNEEEDNMIVRVLEVLKRQ